MAINTAGEVRDKLTAMKDDDIIKIEHNGMWLAIRNITRYKDGLVIVKLWQR